MFLNSWPACAQQEKAEEKTFQGAELVLGFRTKYPGKVSKMPTFDLDGVTSPHFHINQ